MKENAKKRSLENEILPKGEKNLFEK